MSNAPTPASLRSAAALYFADEALSAVRHDVLNRLTAIGAVGYELRGLLTDKESSSPGPRSERLADLNRHIGLITQTVARRLLTPRDARATSNLAEGVFAAVAASAWPDRVTVRPSVDARVRASSTEVAVMVLALVDNGLESGIGVEGESPSVTIYWSLGDDDDAVDLVVEDDGPGPQGEGVDRAFERFFSTKAGRAGLGLSVVRTLAVRVGGHVAFARRADVDRGARVTLTLPLVEDSAPDEGGKEGGKEG